MLRSRGEQNKIAACRAGEDRHDMAVHNISFYHVGCVHAHVHMCTNTHLGTALLLLFHMSGSVKYAQEIKQGKGH